jgi:hypothetical protein
MEHEMPDGGLADTMKFTGDVLKWIAIAATLIGSLGLLSTFVRWVLGNNVRTSRLLSEDELLERAAKGDVVISPWNREKVKASQKQAPPNESKRMDGVNIHEELMKRTKAKLRDDDSAS